MTHYEITFLLFCYVVGLALGFSLGYFVRDNRACNERVQLIKRHSYWIQKAKAAAEKRASWQYHQGAIDTMNALEPKRDKAGRFVSNKTVLSKTEGTLTL